MAEQGEQAGAHRDELLQQNLDEIEAGRKSLLLAGVLGFTCGGLGLFYVSSSRALWTIAACIVVTIATGGAAFLPLWIGCGIWGYVSAAMHNRALDEERDQLLLRRAHPAPHGPLSPPAERVREPEPSVVRPKPQPPTPVRKFPAAGGFKVPRALRAQAGPMGAALSSGEAAPHPENDAAFCIECGKALRAHAKFCAACGTRVAA